MEGNDKEISVCAKDLGERLIAEVGKGCEVCQAHNYPNFQVKGAISFAPVCQELGVSVCVWTSSVCWS